jgi:hypothetical protein
MHCWRRGLLVPRGGSQSLTVPRGRYQQRTFDDLSVLVSGTGAGATAAAAGALPWLARARAVTTRRCGRIELVGFGVCLMIVVVGIDRVGASRREAVGAGRSERFSRRVASDGAKKLSSGARAVARAPFGGHDGRPAAG